MTIARQILAAAACLAAVGMPNQVQADGWPPFGAWAYGTGYPARTIHGHGHHRSVVRTWGGYGHFGYSSVRYPFPHHFYRHHVRRPIVVRSYVSYPLLHSYCFYRPVVTYPVVSYPVLTYPVVVPTYSWPLCAAPATMAPVSTVSTAGLSSSLAGQSLDSFEADSMLARVSLSPSTRVSHKVRLAAAALPESGTNLSTQDSTVSPELPAKLLELVDTMVKLGAYREAGSAYARLSLRYGSSEALLLRRYVAQVLSDDLNQAEVIVNLAQAGGQTLDASSLPGGSLETFLGSAVLIDTATERLAARALEAPGDPIPLRSIATWLKLKGDESRSAMFLARAEQLGEQAQPAPSLELSPSTPVEYVTVD